MPIADHVADRSRPRRRRFVSLSLAVAVLASVVVVAAPAREAAAASGVLPRVITPGLGGHVGIDWGGAYAGGPYENQDDLLFWSASGSGGTFTFPSGLPSIRLEFYPNSHDYDPWDDVGGVHVEVRNPPGSLNVGTVPLPIPGQTYVDRHGDPHPGFRIDGDILSATPVPDGRIEIDAFQVDTAYPDDDLPQPPENEAGHETRAFATSLNRGDRFTMGVGWPGRYVVFVRDTTTGTKITALVDIFPDDIPTLDLDAICFGFDNCTYDAGAPTTAAGEFHATDPTRIVDTRLGLGIANGPVRTGGGRNSSPDPLTRRDEIANHEVQVTGVGEIPESGVSAVLLNVTADQAPGPGFLSLTPKPAACCGPLSIFDDQAALRGDPGTSNLNVAGGDTVPNLVLARVGAGGKIKIYNSFGPTNTIIDVAGWFGTGGAHTDGVGFSGTTPTRLLDSRNGIGGPRRAFSAGESRTVQVAGVAGVPADAESVVVNLTAVDPTGWGFTTAYPDGSSLPTASNLNYVAGAVRANLAVVKVGAGGRIRLRASEASTHLIVDVLGSFGPSGGRVTAIDPARIVDSRGGLGVPGRLMQPQETHHVDVAGVAGVPGNARAVLLNVTATNTAGFGWFTVFPRGGQTPDASNVNFVGGDTVPNMVMVDLGSGGDISIFNGFAGADVIVDVFGYVT